MSDPLLFVVAVLVATFTVFIVYAALNHRYGTQKRETEGQRQRVMTMLGSGHVQDIMKAVILEKTAGFDGSIALKFEKHIGDEKCGQFELVFSREHNQFDYIKSLKPGDTQALNVTKVSMTKGDQLSPASFVHLFEPDVICTY